MNYAQQIARFGSGSSLDGTNVQMTPMMFDAMGGAAQGPGAAANPIATYGQASQSSPTSVWPSGNTGNSGIMTGQMFPQAPGSSFGAKTGLGMNMDTGRLIIGGLQTIGNLWQAWEANKLAKKQFSFQKEFAEKNMANQIKSYNTTLEDRTRSRTHSEGGTQAEAAAYIEKNRLG